MKFISQNIKDLFLIIPDLHSDDRGVFRRSFCKEIFEKNGVNFNSLQGNISENFNKHTLRGFHYQSSPSDESKIITCVTGALFNIVVDLRKKSKTYGKFFKIILNDKNCKSLFIPENFAHGFYVLEENTEVVYKTTDFYNSEEERSIKWDDKDISIRWPLDTTPSLSSKDKEGTSLKKAELPD